MDIWILSYTSSSITVGWTEVTDPALHSYNLALNGSYHGWTSQGVRQYTFDNLIPGTSYTLGVRSIEVPGSVYSPLTTLSFAIPIPTDCITEERYRCGTYNGKNYAFIDQSGQPANLFGVNVRNVYNDLNTYTQTQFDAINSKGFDCIRIVMDWEDFETSNGVFSNTKFNDLDVIINRAEQAGLAVILDPLHIDGSTLRGIPQWAWNPVTPAANKVWDELTVHALQYLTHVTKRYCDNQSVIAIDLVNEPREPSGIAGLPTRVDMLVSLYVDWINTLRLHDPNKIFLVEPFYGCTRINSDALLPLGELRNVVWSLHDYYAGEASNSDGYNSSGYREDNPSGHDTDQWDSTGSYPKVSRSTSIIDMTAHINVHLIAADAAGVPMHIGEFGIPYQWTGKENFMCDKRSIYTDLNLPVTAWVWNRDVDLGFGLYSPWNGSWESQTTNLVASSCGTYTIAQPCPQNLIINNYSLLGSGTEQVDDFIYSNGLLHPGHNLHYKAANSMDLDKGFEIKLGAVFEATIEGCN